MTVQGLPEVDALSNYGGAMADYAPVEDASTDEAAAYRNLYAMNVAGMTQVTPRAWVRFIGNATTPADPAANIHGSVWGNAALNKPAVVRTSIGLYTITWPATIVDALSVTHTLALFTGWVNVEGATPFDCTVTLTAANVAVVRVFVTTTAALTDGVGSTFALYVR